MSVWLKQVWLDKKLAWDPKNYGGVNVLYVPYEMIWVPDLGESYRARTYFRTSISRKLLKVIEVQQLLVLYNNADGNYNITINTKATLTSSGTLAVASDGVLSYLYEL